MQNRGVEYLIITDRDRIVDIVADGSDLTLQRAVFFERRSFDALFLVFQLEFGIYEYTRILFRLRQEM